MSENPNDSAGRPPASGPPTPPPGAAPGPQPTGPAAPGAQPQPPGAPGLVGPETSDAKTMAMLCHLLAIFTTFVGPLIIWLIKKDQSRFVDQQGKEALNWGITVLIAFVAIVVVFWIPILGWIIGCLGWPAVGVCNIVFGILSTLQVNKGLPYRYPVCIRFIK